MKLQPYQRAFLADALRHDSLTLTARVLRTTCPKCSDSGRVGEPRHFSSLLKVVSACDCQAGKRLLAGRDWIVLVDDAALPPPEVMP